VDELLPACVTTIRCRDQFAPAAQFSNETGIDGTRIAIDRAQGQTILSAMLAGTESASDRRYQQVA